MKLQAKSVKKRKNSAAAYTAEGQAQKNRGKQACLLRFFEFSVQKPNLMLAPRYSRVAPFITCTIRQVGRLSASFQLPTSILGHSRNGRPARRDGSSGVPYQKCGSKRGYHAPSREVQAVINGRNRRKSGFIFIRLLTCAQSRKAFQAAKKDRIDFRLPAQRASYRTLVRRRMRAAWLSTVSDRLNES